MKSDSSMRTILFFITITSGSNQTVFLSQYYARNRSLWFNYSRPFPLCQ